MIEVAIIESEAGWGRRVDSIQEFETKEEALSFVNEFNARNNEDTAPSWYIYATIREGE